MALPNYSTGTASVVANGTTVTGAGTIWTGGNVSEGDEFFIGSTRALVVEIVSATQLTITPWAGATLTGATYQIYENSSRRFDDVKIADDLRRQVGALNTEGFYHFVKPGATAPDPSLGDEKQYAFQADTGKLWQKVGGLWNFIGVYKGVNPRGVWNSAAAYAVNDVVSLNGSAYMAIAANTNSAPPNGNWMLLGTGGADATVTVSGTTTGAPGSPASVMSGGTPTNRTLAFTIPRGSIVAVGSTTTGAPGSNATVTNSGTGGDINLNFTVPTGKGYGGTSATSMTIGTGSKTFTTQAGLAYVVGDRVHMGATGNELNWMEGFITAYSSTSMTVAVGDVGGSGTFASWGIGLTGKPGLGDGDMKGANNLLDLSSTRTALANLGVKFGQCVLELASGNLVLSPKNGNLLTIDGVPYPIPNAGVSLAPTGLTPLTLYYVYAYMSAGVMTLEASTTGHSKSTKAGNNGVEIKTGDDSRTLVGMVRPLTGPVFSDTPSIRHVRSWFNRKITNTAAFPNAAVSVSSSSYADQGTTFRNAALLWNDETWTINLTGASRYQTGSYVGVGIGIDGILISSSIATGTASQNVSQSLSYSGLGEGYHYANVMAITDGSGEIVYSTLVNRPSMTGVIR